MSQTKEIRSKIASIKNTQKITRAMEMVAASKMRKAQDSMQRTRPYADKMLQVIHHLAWGNTEYRHPYMLERSVENRVGYIVVSTDRGLCGGLNNNMFKSLLHDIQRYQEKSINVEVAIFGRKAETFFKRLDTPIIGIKTGYGDAVHISDIIGVVNLMLQRYDQNEIDALHIVYNRFVNTMSQKPIIRQLLPLEQKSEYEQYGHYWDYIYEPEAKELLDELLSRYIKSEVYQALVENISCEQAARMVAMKSASDNAGELIKEFQLAYNKVRQAGITQEIAEIVGGAAAV